MQYIDEVEIGSTHEFAARYELTGEEIIEMGTRWDPQPFHTDAEAAKQSMFGGLVAASAHMFCIWSALAADEVDAEHRVHTKTALGFNNMQWHNPARPGDVLHRTHVFKDAHDSNSHPGHMIGTVAETVVNQNGEPVFSLECMFLSPRKPTD